MVVMFCVCGTLSDACKGLLLHLLIVCGQSVGCYIAFVAFIRSFICRARWQSCGLLTTLAQFQLGCLQLYVSKSRVSERDIYICKT